MPQVRTITYRINCSLDDRFEESHSIRDPNKNTHATAFFTSPSSSVKGGMKSPSIPSLLHPCQFIVVLFLVILTNFNGILYTTADILPQYPHQLSRIFTHPFHHAAFTLKTTIVYIESVKRWRKQRLKKHNPNPYRDTRGVWMHVVEV